MIRASLCEIRFILVLSSEQQKSHMHFQHVKLFCCPSTLVCARNKLCLSLGQTGFPVCKIRRKPGFVPGTSRPKANQNKCFYVYVPFSFLIITGCRTTESAACTNTIISKHALLCYFNLSGSSSFDTSTMMLYGINRLSRPKF